MKNKFIHFSIDDVIGVFEDIYVHDYDSIFENELMNDWRDLHEEEGLKLSLYCYYHNTSFSLDKFPNKYWEEFLENSEWLRLGVHAFDYDVAKSEDWRTYYISYIRVMEELLRICGNHVEAIDFFPRLDCYKLPRMTWEKLSDYKYGPKGLLANDRDMGSYFLNLSEEEMLRRDGMVIIDGKPIVRTTIRLEDVKDNEDFGSISYPCICFTHEWAYNKTTREKYRKYIRLICNKYTGGGHMFVEEAVEMLDENGRIGNIITNE